MALSQSYLGLLFFCVAVAVLLLVPVNAVDRTKFRKCDELDFCRSHRDLKRSYHYALDPKSFKASKTRLVADLIKRNEKEEDVKTLKFELTFYGGIARMKVTDPLSVKPRYEVPDVVRDDLAQFESAHSWDKKKTFSFGPENRHKISIDANPFHLSLYDQDELVISVNERNLFKYELPQTKVEEPAATEEKKEEDGEEKPAAPPAEDGESVGLDFTFVGSTQVYGIPEHAMSLALKSTRKADNEIISDPYRLYNLDVFEYELDETMALYGHVPLMFGHGPHQKTSAVFWLNSAETWVDVSDTAAGALGKNTHWMSESGIVDVFFLMGPTPKEVFSQYTFLTGVTPLPQLFSIAYHQCRWNYKNEDDVKQVDAGFDEHNIPVDVLWLDIEHTDSKKYFTWDNNHFPTPKNMLDNIESKGRKMVTIIDPHIKKDTGYHIYTQGKDKGYFVKDNTGGDYEGWCWPGASYYLDFTSADVRSWWAEQFSFENYKGSSPILYTWNDMNEPSVFNGPEVTMPKDNQHVGGWKHRDLHNIYGMYYHRATFEGLIKRDPAQNDRPFVLSRAFFAGSQKYGAVWTGDNAAKWPHLKYATPMLLSLGMAGITFSGADVGGFFDNPEVNLLVRWYQAGAFYPFFRAHAHLDTKRREPWLFGEPHTSIIREAIRIRYALLPFWYTTFHAHTLTGEPVIRPMWVEYPQDDKLWTMDDQYMVGSTLLVKPIVEDNVQQTNVYLPSEDIWFDYHTHKAYGGPPYHTLKVVPEKIPVFQRGGTILTRKDRPRRSSSQMVDDPYTLVVALNKAVHAEGELYVDDGHSFNYQKGEFLRRKFVYDLTVLSSRAIGDEKFDASNTVERVIILGLGKAPTKAVLKQEGKADVELEFSYDADPARLTIRKPNCRIADDWDIALDFGSEEATTRPAKKIGRSHE